MANLAALLSRRRECDNRGQLILVTAFALAAILIGLAIVINSAIFTENLATRNENVESTEALEYRYDVIQYTGDIIGFANENNHTSHSEILRNVTDGINDSATYTGREQIAEGAALSLVPDKDSVVNGSRIYQNDGSNFTNNQSDDDWRLAEKVENTRAFELELTDIDSNSDFTIVANDTSDPSTEWTATINSTAVTVDHPDENEKVCEFDEITSVDITGATVNDGRPCPALEDTEDGNSTRFATGVGDEYAIEFEDGDDIVEGNYSLVVAGENLDYNETKHYADISGPGDSPYVSPALYSVDIELEYETRQVEYETVVTVAPGEPR